VKIVKFMVDWCPWFFNSYWRVFHVKILVYLWLVWSSYFFFLSISNTCHCLSCRFVVTALLLLLLYFVANLFRDAHDVQQLSSVGSGRQAVWVKSTFGCLTAAELALTTTGRAARGELFEMKIGLGFTWPIILSLYLGWQALNETLTATFVFRLFPPLVLSGKGATKLLPLHKIRTSTASRLCMEIQAASGSGQIPSIVLRVQKTCLICFSRWDIQYMHAVWRLLLRFSNSKLLLVRVLVV
jgi:hypothetical protein